MKALRPPIFWRFVGEDFSVVILFRRLHFERGVAHLLH